MSNALFNAFQFGDFAVDNRIAMAPMTRSRTSQPGDVPNDMMATYYQQRATAGLIITEEIGRASCRERVLDGV